MTDLRTKIARAMIAEAILKALVFTSENSKAWADGLARDIAAVLDLDSIRAEAWDEGHESAAMRVPECVWSDTAAPHPGNPYRKADQ